MKWTMRKKTKLRSRVRLFETEIVKERVNTCDNLLTGALTPLELELELRHLRPWKGGKISATNNAYKFQPSPHFKRSRPVFLSRLLAQG